MPVQLNSTFLDQVGPIIAKSEEETKAREAADIAKGVKLSNNPTATMTSWLSVAEKRAREPDEEDLVCWLPGGRWASTHHVRFRRGEVGYLETRRQWDSFAAVRKLFLEHVSPDEEDFLEVGPSIFRWTFGVLSLVRRSDETGTPHLLVGIRSKQLGGRHVGTISFPGGLVKPGETIEQAARRQLREECEIELNAINEDYAIGHHPNAASSTFVCVATTSSKGDLADSFEWKGGKALWAPEADVVKALAGDNTAMVDAFKRAGHDVSEGVPIAPDAAPPAKLLLSKLR